MASFDISMVDILKISLSAHACLLLRSGLGKAADCLLPLLAPCSWRFRALHRLHEWAPDLMPRLVSEHASLLVLATLSLVALSHTSVSVIPFGHQSQPRPDYLIRFVLSACAARYIVMTSWLLLGRDVTLRKSGTEAKVLVSSATGESGLALLDFLYLTVCAGMTLLSLGCRQNFLLAMTLPFQELSAVFSAYCTLSEVTAAIKSNRHRIACASDKPFFGSARSLSLVSCIICLVCRGVLPTLFLALALQRESPFVMDWLPLSWFFLSCAFLTTFHIVLIYQEILNFINYGKHAGSVKDCKKYSWRKAIIDNLESFSDEDMGLKTTQEGMETLMTRGHKGHSLSCHNHHHSLTNDIYQDIVLDKQDEIKCQLDRLRDLNYGLLRPFDNRNISSCAGDSDYTRANEGDDRNCSKVTNNITAAEKMNVVRKKDMSKTWLLYRLLANSLPSSSPLPSDSVSSPLPSDAFDPRGSRGESDLQPWMFPALFDASSNTKLYCQTPVVHACHGTQKYPENIDSTNSRSLNPDEPYISDNSIRSSDSWQALNQEGQKNNSSTLSEEQSTTLLPSSFTIRRERETEAGDHVPETCIQLKDDVHLNCRFSTNTAPQAKSRYKGRHRLPSDCVQLLNGSKDSLEEAFAVTDKGFSSV
ncbi:hypothetical protein EGW08_008072 [Elysia chlorotica]|uniref:Uncharacterized protein n=1 Tax=Elysia chlorotica TaxID=188477 RepID=A0A433TRG5_ELYCH|nr:hypothetical protein EGW08_008072 [Elysia chlorotica]